MVDKTRVLYRLPRQGKIFGVAAGLADYFDLDVTLMRVIFVLLTFVTGGGMIVAYIILALVMPVQGQESTDVDKRFQQLGKDLKDSKTISRTRNYFGIALIVIGVWLLLVEFYPQIFMLRWDYIWPVLLIIVGVLVMARRRDDGR